MKRVSDTTRWFPLVHDMHSASCLIAHKKPKHTYLGASQVLNIGGPEFKKYNTLLDRLAYVLNVYIINQNLSGGGGAV